KPEIPRAPHRQEEQKQRGHWSEEVKETKEVAPLPGGLYEETERDSPQPAPEERPVYTRRLKGCRKVYRTRCPEPEPGQNVAEKEYGQCTQNSRREADRQPLTKRRRARVCFCCSRLPQLFGGTAFIYFDFLRHRRRIHSSLRGCIG